MKRTYDEGRGNAKDFPIYQGTKFLFIETNQRTHKGKLAVIFFIKWELNARINRMHNIEGA